MALFDFLKRNKDPKTVSITVDTGTDLQKAVMPVPSTKFLEDQVEKSKAVFSLDTKQSGVDSLYEKHGRLQDKDLKDIANYDAIIGLIVNTRANQMMTFGRKSNGKYERGFILQEKIPVQENIFLSSEEKEQETRRRLALASKITEYVSTCGTDNHLIKQQVFKGSDSYFKDCSLSDFLAAQTLNLLIFGRAATQIIRNKDGVPIMFRPLPVETIKPVIDQEDITVDTSKDATEQSVRDSKEYSRIEKGRRPTVFVQRMDGKNVAFFTDKELKMTYLRKQAFENLDGYPLAPIEQAYYTVSLHFYAQQYQQNIFTKGLASKGMINLKTEDGGVISPEQVEMFRKLFTNYVARNDNSATIPVISGPIEAKFVPLNATAKDLEFLQLYNKVISILCGCFQIAPQEIGFGNLESGTASLGDSGGKQDQIVQGEERGLRQLADALFALLDEIVYETFEEAKSIFKFSAIGLGQNSKEADLALYREELQTSGTFGKIWADSERIESFPFGGNVPTSPLFHSSVAPYMKMSEMRHYFFGDKDALQRPEYDFFLDISKNEMYQSLKNKNVQMSAEQQAIQLEQMEMQLDMQKQQMSQPPAQEQEQQAPEEDNESSQAQEDLHRIKVEETKHKMQMKQEKHELEMEKMKSDISSGKVDKEKMKQILQQVLKDRPQTLSQHYKKSRKDPSDE